jgi:simple sugar transport system permease protein
MELGFFQPNVTLGLGFIAIALAMLGRWSPWRIAIIAILFGMLRGLGSGLQLTRWDVSPDLLNLLPYIGVIVALILTGKGLTMPSALGQTYARRRRRRQSSGTIAQE